MSREGREPVGGTCVPSEGSTMSEGELMYAVQQLPIYTNVPEDNATLAALAALRLRCDGKDMSLQKLRLICKETGLPQCPAACTRLELQCQLLTAIGEDLGLHYTELKSLRLDKNQIGKIENLCSLQKLEALYLQENRIACIEGLHMLTNLSVLNLSHNKIDTIRGLSSLPRLHTLILGDNILSTLESVQHLCECRSLEELDLSTNRISDVGLVGVLEEMPNLQTLTLLGNPVSNASDPRNNAPPILPNYRRTLVGRCRALTALDHRPIFPQERNYCNAWWDAQIGSTDPVKEAEEIAKADTLLQADALYPVFRCLSNPRDLLSCAQVSVWWCDCIQPRLREMELSQAEVEAKTSVMLWKSSAPLISGLHKKDFQVLRCQGSQTPPGPLMQLLYALQMLWDIATSGSDIACLPDYPELEWATWRRQVCPYRWLWVAEAALRLICTLVWAAVQDMLHSPDFPLRLANAPVLMSPATVKHLRALTGSADDLEVYVPELDVGGVERINPACGRLCHWLLAAERHLYATVRLEEALERFHVYSGILSSEEGNQTDRRDDPSPTGNCALPQHDTMALDEEQRADGGAEETENVSRARQADNPHATRDGVETDSTMMTREMVGSSSCSTISRVDDGEGSGAEAASPTTEQAARELFTSSTLLRGGDKGPSRQEDCVDLDRESPTAMAMPCTYRLYAADGANSLDRETRTALGGIMDHPLSSSPRTSSNSAEETNLATACATDSILTSPLGISGSGAPENAEVVPYSFGVKEVEEIEHDDLGGTLDSLLEALSTGGMVNNIPYI